MKRFLLASLLLLIGCAGKPTAPSDVDYFAGKRGCFLLYDVKAKKFEKVIGEAVCRERIVACSTFKVPLAVMAFDSGILRNENQVLKWNGVKGFLDSHNRDHDAKSWMKESVVWFSQALTPKLGKERFQKYLHDFHYGNESLAGGITEAWLVSPGDSAPALRISPYEQVEFLRNLWSDALPVSKRAMKLTREITFLETSPKGFRLHGKTGSNFFEKNEGQEMRRGLGWFIAHLENGEREYIAVTNFRDVDPTDARKFGGPRAKDLTKAIFADLGLW